MGILDYFFPQHEKIPRLGRISPIDVEIQDTIGDWYYHGKVELFETEAEIGEGDKKEKKKLYFYRLLTKYREDERIIVSDDDFIQNSNQIPYTQTVKGQKKLQQVILFTFSFIYLLTVYLAYLLVQAGPNIIYYPQVVNMLIWDFGTIASVFAIGAIIWAVEARYHHYVLDWQIQPLLVNAEKAKTDYYILVNSSKIPVIEKTKQLFQLPSSEIEKLIHAIRLFQDTTIKNLIDENNSLTQKLNDIDIEGFAIGKKSLEMSLATREQRLIERLDTIKWVAITFFISVMIGFIVYISMGGRL